MIQVKQKDIPDILQKEQNEWTARLINLVKEYDGYDKIPDNLKNEAVNKYRHKDIKEAVIDTTKGKCIFCEAYIEDVDYPNIEHFFPKSLHPKYTFKWSNLFPACRKCNIPKGNFDTKVEPFIHPQKDNPEDFFTYNELKIQISSSAPDYMKAKNTIDKCKLDRITLCRQHSEILLSFYEVEADIESTITHYSGLKQNARKLESCTNILDSIDNLKMQTKYSKPFAGFLRCVIKNSPIIKSAIDIINSHSKDIGIDGKYDFKWNVSS